MNPTKLSRQRTVMAVLALVGTLVALPAAATLTISGVTCASATASADANGNVTISCSAATAGLPTVGDAPNQSATVGTAFGLALSSYVSGVQGTPSYSLPSGTLPAGLSLNSSTGLISGTPSAAGTSTVTWTVTGSNGTATPADSITFTVSTVAAPSVGNAPDQAATVGTAFSLALSGYVSGVQGTPAYSLATGTLPAGLSLNSATGLISGTPTVVGSSTVTWTVTGSNGTGTPDQIIFTVSAAAATGACSGGTVWANFLRPGQTTGGTLSGGQTAGAASYSFVMDPTANNGLFANGAKILGEVTGSYYNPRDTVVADCPNVFDTPPAVPQGMTANTLTNCGRIGTMYPNIYLGYTNNANTQLFYSCNLQPGHTYYLNMRSNYDATSGTYLPAGYLISSQSR